VVDGVEAKLSCLLGAALLLRMARRARTPERASQLEAQATAICWHIAKHPDLRSEGALLAAAGVTCARKGTPAGSR
jgi:hypothetical protein